MNVKTFLLLCLIFTISNNKVSCGLFEDMGGWFKGNVDNVSKVMFEGSGELIEKAKKAFYESMDKLFDEKLGPMIKQIEAVISRNLDKIDETIQHTIDNFKDSVMQIINTASKQAKDLIGSTIEKIKENIINYSYDKAKELESKIMNDIVIILNKIDETIYHLTCSAKAIEMQIRDDLMQSLWFIPYPWDSCRIELDQRFPGHYFRWKFFSWYGPNELYEYRKCYLIIGITEKTPIKSVIKAYKDLEQRASEMRCLSVAYAATSNLIYYVKEMSKARELINLWEKYQSPKGKLQDKRSILTYLQ